MGGLSKYYPIPEHLSVFSSHCHSHSCMVRHNTRHNTRMAQGNKPVRGRKADDGL